VEAMCARLANDVIEISEVLPLDAPADCNEKERGARIREAALAARGAFSVLFVHTDGAGDSQRARTYNVLPATAELAAHFEKDGARVVAVVPVRETNGTSLSDVAVGHGCSATWRRPAATCRPEVARRA
jgi:hypothetical protein